MTQSFFNAPKAHTSAVGLLPLLSRIALIAALAIVAVLAIALFFFAVPVWDDLIRATRPVEVGWWGYVIDFVYKHWQGRWASCGLESFVLPRLDLTRRYWMLIGAVAAVDAIAAYTVCRWFTPNASRPASAVLTAGLLALLWTGMPSVGETVYWFTGAVENAMVYALAALLLMALIRLPADAASRFHQSLAIAGLSIAAVCIVGLHELYGGMLCVALALGTLNAFINAFRSNPARTTIPPAANRSGSVLEYEPVQHASTKQETNVRQRHFAHWLTVTVAAVIGLGIVVLAPGNSARFISDGGRHARQPLYDLKVALSQVRHFIPRWIIDPKLLAASVWVIATPMLRRANTRPSGPSLNSGFPWRWLIPAAWLIMLTAGFFAPSWAFGDVMPQRTLSGVYIIFVLGWLITLHLWAPMLPKINPVVRPIALLMFSISLLIFGNAIATAHDLYRRIRPWHTAAENRYAILRNVKGTDALVPLLPTRPWILLDGEIVDDPGDYRNWSTVSFFHLRSIRLIPKTGSPRPPPEYPTRPPASGANH